MGAIRKGKYSKLGCMECKRRKIKCDESKPVCWHCDRLSKTCVYPARQQKRDLPNVDLAKSLEELLMDQIGDFQETPASSSLEIPELAITPRIGKFDIGQFSLDTESRKYLQLFYDEFTQVIFPFNVREENVIREVILNHAINGGYLLSAVLACGALRSYHKSSSEADEKSYVGYLSKCMKLLSNRISKGLGDELESMILTTLLITSYNASSNVVKWRPHLEAAGRMLMNENIAGEVYSICRCWFISIEILAGLSSKIGGTISNEEWKIMEGWIEDTSQMENLGLIWKNAWNGPVFNLMYGYTNKLGVVLGRLCLLLKETRQNGCGCVSIGEIGWLMEMLDSEDIKSFKIWDGSGYLRKIDGIVPAELLESVEEFDDLGDEGGPLWASWWDISYQSHRIVGIIQVLTELMQLPREHLLVRRAIGDAMRILRFLRSGKRVQSYSVLMFQLCVFLVGKWTCLGEDRVYVVKFFQELRMFGNVSAQHSLDVLESLWSGRRVSDDEDIISY
ncbi:uncharacterized protein C5L36_0A09970 [Pichia kudriavzevii]|uniref:Zn(2)-C6 fungal-type domain-containing protein n=1 Tax=Pichia kudriavzevii TaxID=4909 RepID=A0A099NVD6_PICKU|nr:uncharacterized protein C5L36_0A09970 [Pichia kudriavzevii]AWU74410.1 hypothetical protein C5L36_0A09970 [Pichia kudriavzevii]KGK36590.1 hypothetical protein JL09_g4264 [Pichia kudriavzevii]